jgi:hypothetical protein
MIHGLGDIFLMPGVLNDTWRYLEDDLTLLTVPNAGHWVHHDAADLVTNRMVGWRQPWQRSWKLAAGFEPLLNRSLQATPGQMWRRIEWIRQVACGYAQGPF